MQHLKIDQDANEKEALRCPGQDIQSAFTVTSAQLPVSLLKIQPGICFLYYLQSCPSFQMEPNIISPSQQLSTLKGSASSSIPLVITHPMDKQTVPLSESLSFVQASSIRQFHAPAFVSFVLSQRCKGCERKISHFSLLLIILCTLPSTSYILFSTFPRLLAMNAENMA